MIYRVVLKVGYNVTWFEFAEAAEAVLFAQTALMHQVGCDDTKKKSSITLEIVNPDMEESEED